MNESIAAQLGALKGQLNKVDQVYNAESVNATPTAEPISQGSDTFEQRHARPRKRMREDTSFGALGPEQVTIQVGGTKTSMHMSDSDRKKLADSVIHQHKVANASGWADVAARFGTAALSIVGAVAMTWALTKGVKAGTKGD